MATRIVSVVGNRPQFVKAAPLHLALQAVADVVMVDTGQHYDHDLAGIFYEELGIAPPAHALGVGSGSHAEMTARILERIEPVLADERPDWVVVYGDTNSTLAGALAASKLQLEIAHVEAGLRSFDRSMPEELNRVLTDHASDLLLCPSQTAVDNLRREGVAGEVVLVGDVMVDVANLFQPRAREETPAFEPPYVLVTAHRAGNVDDPERLAALVDLLLAVPEDVILPLHPRTRARLESAGLLGRLAAGVELLAPQGYLDFTSLLVHARAVLTDSGGVQKEAYLAGVPCVTLRDTTEWAETVDAGWNVLVDLDGEAALAALQRRPPHERPELYGDGRAGERVVSSLSA